MPFIFDISKNIKIVAISVSRSAKKPDLINSGFIISKALELKKGKALLIGTTDFTHAGPWYRELPPKNMKLHDYVRNKDKVIIDSILNDNLEEKK